MITMMKLAGVSSKYASQCSLQEFIRQSDNYQDLDRDNLNQVYKFLLYNGGQGVMLSHPFPVERRAVFARLGKFRGIPPN
jgi:hypothetical protein